MKSRRRVSVIETRSFLDSSKGLLDDDARALLVDHLSFYPDAGDLIPGSGGIRKLRWAAKGKGKRGGARVVHFFADDRFPVFLLFAYAKDEQENLAPADVADFRKLTKRLLDGFSVAKRKDRT